MDDLTKKFQGWKEKIDQALEEYLPREEPTLFEAMHYALFSGGKRFRPLLLFSAGHYFRALEEEMVPVACAVEFIHSYSLIHDDLPSLDNDDFRRGKPSLHRAFGEAIALLAGDALLTLAFQVVAEASFSPSRLAIKVEIVRRLSQAAGVSGMIGGQIQDLQLTDEVRDEARFLAMVGKKTGQLITFSVMTGGLLGEASERERRALFNFGQNLGLAFQLRDDLADLNQDEQARQQAKNSPNYALVFGQAKTRQEVNSYVDKAVGALKEGGINSPELIYLSEKLRVEKEDVC